MEELTQAFLGIVSEKTGYPPEMLDLSMDMEADLGIDSIKRVEILGAVRDVYPELPKVSPEDFAELRSLRQVIEHVHKSMPGAAAPEPVEAAVAQAVEAVPSPAVAEALPAVEAVPSADLTQALLAVVSEKTGYPTEMLELGMDMEADLGIDSIKKVEIMGAMREAYPSLSKADPEAFAEARTLGQVATYLGKMTEATPLPFSEGQR